MLFAIFKVIEVVLGTLLLLLPIFIIHHTTHFTKPYSLFEYTEWDELSFIMEIQRFLIILAVGFFLFRSARLLSLYIPKYLAFILGNRSQNDKISSTLEILYLSWPYLMFCLASFILLITLTALFRFPPHIDEIPIEHRPWQFFFIRTALLLFLLSIVLLFEKIGIKKLTIDFHKAAYADRFQKNRFGLWVIERLMEVCQVKKEEIEKEKEREREREKLEQRKQRGGAGARRHSLPHGGVRKSSIVSPTGDNQNGNNFSVSFQQQQQKEEKEGINFEDEWEEIEDEEKKSASSRRAKYQGEVDVSLVFHYLSQDPKSLDFKLTGENKFIVFEIFKLLANPESDLLSISDIEPYFDEKLVDKCWSCFSQGSPTLSRQSFYNSITAILEERYNLVLTSHDHNRVVNRMDKAALTVAMIISTVMFLLLLEFPVQDIFTPLAPLIVGAIFLTAPSLKTIFDSVVFLFMTHPYDVGDRIYMENENMFVQEIGLLSTTFLTWDSKILFLSNSVLASKTIFNVRRSLSQVQQISLQLSLNNTKSSKLLELQSKIKSFLKENPDLFYSKFNFYISELPVQQNMIQVMLHIRHVGNFQFGLIRWDRCNKFTIFLIEVMKEMGFEYTLLDQPIEIEMDRYQQSFI